MSFTAQIQRTIHASVDKVWDGLTNPELVRQYFFGTNMITSWEPGSSIFFRGEWEGTAYEDKGTVLRFEPGKLLEYDYLSSWSGDEDKPENYQRIVYEVAPSGSDTLLTITQSNIPSEDKKTHSEANWDTLVNQLRLLIEQT